MIHQKTPHLNTKRSTKSGFTIIEVSLATALLSVLLITISIITINIINIYQKGNTIKSVNSVGRNLLDDIETAINASLPARQITQDKFDTEYFRSLDNGATGAFCTGQYSYIWADSEHRDIKLVYDGGERNNIRFLKVHDSRRQVCINYNNDGNGNTDIRASRIADFAPTTYDLVDEPEELLTNNDNDVNLYVYSFKVNPIQGNNNINQTDVNASEVFFSGEFLLGTNRGVDVNRTELSASNCKVGSEGEDFDYCAINRFKFAARTAGKVE